MKRVEQGNAWRDSRAQPPRRVQDGKHVLAVGRDEDGVYQVVVHSELVREHPMIYPCWQRLPAFPPGLSNLSGAGDFSVGAGLLEEDA